VVGFNPSYAANPDVRVQCVFTEENGTNSAPILIKPSHLVPLEANIMQDLMSASAKLSDEEIKKGLIQGLASNQDLIENPEGGRTDLMHRIQLYRNVLEKLIKSKKRCDSENALEDADYCLPCQASPAIPPNEEEPFDRVLRVSRPACVGNNYLDLRHMDIGLKGDGVTTCSICTSSLDPTETELITLPCVHQFHTSCIMEWLSSDIGKKNWNCPTCRKTVPHNMTTYVIQYEEELRNRFQEYLLSGFCAKCMLWVMERNRNESLHTMNEIGEQFTMGESIGKANAKSYICLPKK
jgi:hypothetical protein